MLRELFNVVDDIYHATPFLPCGTAIARSVYSDQLHTSALALGFKGREHRLVPRGAVEKDQGDAIRRRGDAVG